MFSKLTHQTPKSRNKYMLKYNPNLGWFEIKYFSFSKTDSDDGGIPGVSVEWYGPRGQNGWYVFNSEKQFWADSYFCCAVDYA
jgi:REP element-mobilizing transposase RayT